MDEDPRTRTVIPLPGLPAFWTTCTPGALLELDGADAHLEVHGLGLTKSDLDRGRLRGVADELHPDLDPPFRHGRQQVLTRRVGERPDPGPTNRDLSARNGLSGFNRSDGSSNGSVLGEEVLWHPQKHQNRRGEEGPAEHTHLHDIAP
jgi:hypothetical protein